MADAASLLDSLTSSASSTRMSADMELTLPATLHTTQTLMVAMTPLHCVFNTDAHANPAECSASAVQTPTTTLYRLAVVSSLTSTITAQPVAVLPKVTFSVEPKHT